MNAAKWKALFLAFLALPVSLFCADDGNMILNGDFSLTDANGRPAHWSGKLPEGSGVVRDAAPGGGNALYLDRTGQLVWQTVKVEGGKSYGITYLLKTDFPKWRSAASFQKIGRAHV